MEKYLFFLGKNKELSVLELVSYLIKNNINYNLIKITDYYAYIEIKDFDYKNAIDEFGGILKIAKFFDLNNLIIEKNKILYGVEFFYDNKDILNKLKTRFKEERVKAILKKPRNKIVFLPKESNRLDIEIIILKNCIFKVVANSNPSVFKERDEKRPYFDKLKVTSLRLCKILINLSQIKKNNILLDPFAGVGSILQEAMISGFNVIGTEIDKESADGCVKNLEWIKNKYKLISEFKVYNIDNKDIDKFINYADCIVTEPYFGPFFRKIPKYEDICKIAQGLEKSYYILLLKLKKIVKKDGLIIFPVPVYKTNKGRININFEEIINKAGFVVYTPLNSIKIPIKYNLKGSIVERLIYILKN